MTSLEFIVVIGGLFLGYWVVSKLLLGDKINPSAFNTSQKKDNKTSHPQDEQNKSWYKILDISQNASVDEIRRSYKSLMGQYHPDKVATLGNELKDLADHKSKEITQAYREAMRSRGADA